MNVTERGQAAVANDKVTSRASRTERKEHGLTGALRHGGPSPVGAACETSAQIQKHTSMAHLRHRSPNIQVSKRSTKRSITIANHKTSISLENEYWACLRKIAAERGVSLAALVAAIDANRQHANLSSAIRIFVLQFYRYQVRVR